MFHLKQLYFKIRYGGFSFGQKNLWARLNTDHVKQILTTIAETSSRQMWQGVKDIMDHIAVHNISKVRLRSLNEMFNYTFN